MTGTLFLVGLLAGTGALAQTEARQTATTIAGSFGVADQNLWSAVEHHDLATLRQLLDPDFHWVDRNGKRWERSQALAIPSGFVVSKENVNLRDYRTLVFLTGSDLTVERKTRFVRVWVSRAEGWRLLLQQDTSIVGNTASAQATVPAGTKCENPCKTIPYKASSREAQAVAASWQALEVAVNARDAEGWALHVADEFVFNVKEDGNPLTKADRIATIKKQSEGASVTDIGAVLPDTMKIWILGDAALMTDTQQPTVGGNPYQAMRVWVKRDAGWQLAYSQQTSVQEQ